MPNLLPVFKKAYWSLAALGGVYATLVILLTSSWVQKHALYAHRAHTLWLQDVIEPEGFGFARRQVTPFTINSPDGLTLFAWHVLPAKLYAANEQELGKEPAGNRPNFKETSGYRLLTEDSEARVVVMFHGNAGHIAQSHRPQIYRSLSLSDSHLHVFAIDYRGFGHSEGEPSEGGLILDGIALVQFILSLGVPPERIIIVGQSLGTAVSSAVALHFADRDASIRLLPEPTRKDVELMQHFKTTPSSIDFAAVVLVASFPSVPELLPTYKLGGIVPVLQPLRFYPRIQQLLLSTVVDKWMSAKRLAALAASAAARKDGKLNLELIHALDDSDIPWRNGEQNWESASAALELSASGVKPSKESDRYDDSSLDTGSQRGLLPKSHGLKSSEDDFGREGFRRRLLYREGMVKVSFEAIKYGGHNQIVSSIPATLAVLKGFGLA